MEAEGRGLQEMLTKQAAGLSEVVRAAGGNANDAIRLMVADKLEELVRIQVEAVKNIKIDKVTVWDGGGKDGTTSTANFLSGLMKSIPPMSELFNMAGMELPEYLAKVKDTSNVKGQPAPAEEVIVQP
jgi:flotillin